MKNLITGMVLLSILSLFSCTKTIYTHQQVLDRYKTKQDVSKTFGIPTEKKTSDNAEQWLYKFEKDDSFREHTVKEYHNTQTATVTDFNKYNRYLIFTFDLQGNVTRCDYSGVDLTVKAKDKEATIVIIALGAVVLVGLIVIAASVPSDIGYGF
ncbi:MAG: hypothetical protein JWQ66_4383 [Mucilaginibacter sp.]|nr:hypothetical protein [Mucilaginibacter sp.]